MAKRIMDTYNCALRLQIRPYTKNNDIKFVQIIKPLYDILIDQINKAESSYVFHIKGEPLAYRQIQHHYNRAFKKANLQFSGTHVL